MMMMMKVVLMMIMMSVMILIEDMMSVMMMSVMMMSVMTMMIMIRMMSVMIMINFEEDDNNGLMMISVCCFQGILGSIHSGKSALVHRYLTGSYMQEESPEGEWLPLEPNTGTINMCISLNTKY